MASKKKPPRPDVASAWPVFKTVAENTKNAGGEFLGYKVKDVQASKVVIERVATGSEVTITASFVTRAFEKLKEAGWEVPRRSLDYTVAKESSLVHLHPQLRFSEDGKRIELAVETPVAEKPSAKKKASVK